MRSLVESLLLSNVPFVHFDGEGTAVCVSPEARLLLSAHAEFGLACLSVQARRLASADLERLAPQEFTLRAGERSLAVGAVAMLAAAGRVEVLMVLSLMKPASAADASSTGDAEEDVAGAIGVRTPAALERYFDERHLTGRERQVAEYIATGLPSAAIAGRLNISVHTVRRHTERVFSKTGARSRAELTRLVMEFTSEVAKAEPDPLLLHSA